MIPEVAVFLSVSIVLHFLHVANHLSPSVLKPLNASFTARGFFSYSELVEAITITYQTRKRRAFTILDASVTPDLTPLNQAC